MAASVQAQTFYRSYESTGSYPSVTLCKTNDSGFAFTSYSEIYKVDKDGNSQWANEVTFDWRSLIQSSTGGYFSFGAYGTSNYRIKVMKLMGDGSFGFIRGYYFGTSPLVIQTLCPTTDGGFLMAGDANGTACIVRCDSNGNLVWENQYSGIARFNFCVIPAHDTGSYIVDASSPADSSYYSVYEINGSGSVLWCKMYRPSTGLGYCNPIDIDWDGSGYVLADRMTSPVADSLENMIVTRIDGAGNLVWMQQYQSEARVQTDDIAANAEGEVLLTGQQVTDVSTGAGNYLYYLLDSTGTLKWAKSSQGAIDIYPVNEYYITAVRSATNNRFFGLCYGSSDHLPMVMLSDTGGFCNSVPIIFNAVTNTDAVTVNSLVVNNFTLSNDDTLTVPTVGVHDHTDTTFCSAGSDGVTAATMLTNELSVFPNPCQGICYVAHAPAGARIVVADLTGRQVLVTSATTENEPIDMTHLPAGIYSLQICGNTQVQVFKIVKE